MRAAVYKLRAWGARHRTWLFLLGLGGVLALLYWPAVTMQGVFYVGDIYRLGYPARLAYAQALRQGHIPLWTPDALGGYPVLAEGQTGSYYPLNLLLYRLLPITLALNYSVLLSFWIAGAGAFAYARTVGLRRGPAFLSGCVFMLGGFLPDHLDHLNMLAAAAWLPLLLWALERALQRPGWRPWTLVAVIFGVQGLAGHPQVSLLTALLAAGYAALGPLARAQAPWSVRRQARSLAFCVAALGMGGALALVQWLPSYELTHLSQRGQGLDSDFFTSFSINPLYYIALLWPFIRGNPYPLTSLEMIAYVGALPLLFAGLAPVRRRDRLVLFWSLAAVAALLLAMGRFNPGYRVLRHIPVINMFRAPARYMVWFDLAVAVLAGVTFDSLLSLTRSTVTRVARWSPVSGILLVGVAGVAVQRVSLDTLVASWKWLPLVWLGGAVLLILFLRRRPWTPLWASLVVGLVLADLSAFNGVYNQTYNAVMPPAEMQQPPRALSFLQSDSGNDLYRIYTSEEIVPWLPGMRESLYPNIQVLYGVQSLNGYYPLVPVTEQRLFENLNSRLLDLLNVRYVLIPQVLPNEAAAEFYNLEDPFAPSIVGRAFSISPQPVAALEVEGYLTQSENLPNGAPVAEITLHSVSGQEVTWTLRAGNDLAEWAYMRDDVQPVVQHSLPTTLARTWPARSGSPPRDHLGQTALAHFDLPQEMQVDRIEVRPIIARGNVRLERLRLIDANGRAQLLSDLVGEGDHILVYRSDDVAIYRNENAGPRAFLVHRSRVVPSDDEADRILQDTSFQPHQEVILQQGKALQGQPVPGDSVVIQSYQAERVHILAKTTEDAYLVLADSYYPGWRVTVDGQPATLLCADTGLRAVFLSPGQHDVEFQFHPTSWIVGQWASIVAWAAVCVVAVTGAWQVWRQRTGRG